MQIQTAHEGRTLQGPRPVLLSFRCQALTVHGWIYDIGNGLLEDLGISMKSFDNPKEATEGAADRILSGTPPRP